MINTLIKFFLDNRLVTFLLLFLFVGWGISLAPFDWELENIPRDPVAVDAIPDLGENQQIVFTKWPGRSPQDVEDQITYPLTTALLGIPGVKDIRSNSMFGFSSIYIIFEEGIDFYWSRSRILEKLNSLPPDLLPEGVNPALGPDATALGQVYWYTLEGRSPEGEVTGGWSLQELRTLQDYYVKYALATASGVAEVASVGGYVREYQVDVRPEALKAYDVGLHQVIKAVSKSNRDVGAKTLEINKVEYLVRGLGYLENIEDLEQAVVKVEGNTPIRIKDVAEVHMGPAERRGILDKEGAEVVGGVVVARFGSNPLEVINNVKDKIAELEPGLPAKTLDDGTRSKVRIVPFYDRTNLIYETLGTLEEALSLEVLITIIVIIFMVVNLRASILISFLLPVAVLMVFIGMKYTGVTANIVALSGIAIAIGTMVDLGIILSENIVRHLDEAPEGRGVRDSIYEASAEVGNAIVAAVMTTIVSFLPVFSLQAAEGKLFHPLAFTKTYALIAAVLVTLIFIPALARIFFGIKTGNIRWRRWMAGLGGLIGIGALFFGYAWAGWTLLMLAAVEFLPEFLLKDQNKRFARMAVVGLSVSFFLAAEWMPLGATEGLFLQTLFIALILLLVLGSFQIIIHFYEPILKWCLRNKTLFMSVPTFLVLLGVVIWLGFDKVFGFAPKTLDRVGVDVRKTELWSGMTKTFPGLGNEFMPSLDEGSFLLMPTSMPHAGIEENKRVLQQLDILAASVPEVDQVVGKAGRVESALDPAPLSMYENIIHYKPKFILNDKGYRQRFKTDGSGNFILKSGDTLSMEKAREQEVGAEGLIPDEDGLYFRNWREKIESPDDIWDEIVKYTKLPGVTSAPKLQPIETRLIMLQTGMRAPMGIKVYGPDLKTIESFAFKLEKYLKEVPSIKPSSVFADRIVGKPYLEIDIDREAISRYGLLVEDIQHLIETAIGGMQITQTVEGRERFPVRVRYPRELRDRKEKIEEILVSTPTGNQIPLGELTKIKYERGPQMIKSENTFLTGYVLFDRKEGESEVEVVEQAKRFLESKIDQGELEVPQGVRYVFSGDYENQVRASKRLSLIVPLSFLVIFLILYFQFRSTATALMVFSGIAVAFAGGFLMIWAYGQPGFADFSIFGTNIRELFQMETINLSVAVWVGFIALFGIATDNGVVLATYLQQAFRRNRPQNLEEVREAVIEGGKKRVRPCLMTTATTLIALLPVLSSSGRGADIMIPMAIPAFGGMTVAVLTVFMVPVLYSAWMERKRRRYKEGGSNE